MLKIGRWTIAIALTLGGAVAADDIGQEEYLQYCAGCHGMEATGNGAMAQMLTVDVPDLTQLAARNDGFFPMFLVIHAIDGRSGLRGHGGPMPIYGRVFSVEAESQGNLASALEARGRILSLAYYLESLQK